MADRPSTQRDIRSRVESLRESALLLLNNLRSKTLVATLATRAWFTATVGGRAAHADPLVQVALLRLRESCHEPVDRCPLHNRIGTMESGLWASKES